MCVHIAFVIRVEKYKVLEGVAAVFSSSSSGVDEYTMTFDKYVCAAMLRGVMMPQQFSDIATATLDRSIRCEKKSPA